MTTSSPRVAAHRRTRFPGKTCFLDFMLARLISAKQVVLVSTGSKVLLFYQGTVYKREPPFFSCGPTHKLDKSFCAWALIDADSKAQGPLISASDYIWPIQASSPQPTQWKQWGKQLNAAVLGMPVWNMEDLKERYVLTAFWHLSTLSFRRRSSLTVLRLQFTSSSGLQQISNHAAGVYQQKQQQRSDQSCGTSSEGRRREAPEEGRRGEAPEGGR